VPTRPKAPMMIAEGRESPAISRSNSATKAARLA
jgi:hypothetical protein